MEEFGNDLSKNPTYLDLLKEKLTEDGKAELGSKLYALQLESRDLTEKERLELGDMIKRNQDTPRTGFFGQLLIPPELGNYEAGHRTAAAGTKAWVNRESVIPLWIQSVKNYPREGESGSSEQQQRKIKSIGLYRVRGTTISKSKKEKGLRPEGSFASFNRDILIVGYVGQISDNALMPVGIRTVSGKSVGDRALAGEFKSTQALFEAMKMFDSDELEGFREFLDLPLGMRVVCKDVSGDREKSKRIYVNYSCDELNFTSHPSAVKFLKVQTLHRAAIEDISSYLKHNKISTAEKLSLMRDMALGVQILHKKFCMIHRDLKMQNILVYRDRGGRLRAKITDFGFLKSTDGALDNHAGTPSYSPPESLLLKNKYRDVIPLDLKNRIKHPPSPQPTDMYSLGMTFFSLLTGMEPTLVKQFWLNPDTWPQMVVNEKTRLDSFEFVNKKISDLSEHQMGMLQALIGSLISVDADRRPNIDQVIEILNHLISLPNDLQG